MERDDRILVGQMLDYLEGKELSWGDAIIEIEQDDFGEYKFAIFNAGVWHVQRFNSERGFYKREWIYPSILGESDYIREDAPVTSKVENWALELLKNLYNKEHGDKPYKLWGT